MVSPPATSEAGSHAAGDTKSEHFEPARVRKLNEKKFSAIQKNGFKYGLYGTIRYGLKP
jgi:hypothetical protein